MNIDVVNMDREVAVLIYRNKIYEDFNHQYALENALYEEGKSLGIDLDNDIDKAASLTRQMSVDNEIFCFDIYVDIHNKGYLVGHSKENLKSCFELISEYALNNNLILGVFNDFEDDFFKIINKEDWI